MALGRTASPKGIRSINVGLRQYHARIALRFTAAKRAQHASRTDGRFYMILEKTPYSRADWSNCRPNGFLINMPITTERKAVQDRILEYAEANGWTFMSREEAEQRLGFEPQKIQMNADAEVEEDHLRNLRAVITANRPSGVHCFLTICPTC